MSRSFKYSDHSCTISLFTDLMKHAACYFFHAQPVFCSTHNFISILLFSSSIKMFSHNKVSCNLNKSVLLTEEVMREICEGVAIVQWVHARGKVAACGGIQLKFGHCYLGGWRWEKWMFACTAMLWPLLSIGRNSMHCYLLRFKMPAELFYQMRVM